MTYVPPTTIYPPMPPVLKKIKITRDPYVPLYCKHCGAYIPESSDVCVSCGRRIDSMPAKTKEKKQNVYCFHADLRNGLKKGNGNDI